MTCGAKVLSYEGKDQRVLLIIFSQNEPLSDLTIFCYFEKKLHQIGDYP